jgi:flagellar hook-length control protein FliK
MQGKGGSMEDRPGNFSQSENLAALKAESMHQGLHSETGNVRPAGAKGEPALQPNSGALFNNQTEMIGKITQAARLTSSPGTSEISIRLEPDHLGQMRVRLSVDENHFVSARIQVESQEARSLIESSLQRLRESLGEHGLKVEKFSVDVRQDQNQQQGQNSATADRDNPTRTPKGYFSEDKPVAAEVESSFVPEEKTASIRKLGYNTLEWVA